MASQAEDFDQDENLLSQINVTPFVDVVLVLLVIFMVTAPMLAREALELSLPKAGSGQEKPTQTLAVAINRNGQILVDGLAVSESELAGELSARAQGIAGVVVSADKQIDYGLFVKVVDLIKSSGIEKLAIEVLRENRE
ncbi:MAG: biopolymer transporter ExbD [Bdellovibrionales bacterium CG10_big_fil_rev_8_21_14_0_10_45_34]|nr:MAG: biopolymer transporter ExbD [Bdellovibrionales bacterium CG10_big_fil_rev_8_21_14_0_10_45_34]